MNEVMILLQNERIILNELIFLLMCEVERIGRVNGEQKFDSSDSQHTHTHKKIISFFNELTYQLIRQSAACM